MSLQNTQNLITDLCRDNSPSVIVKQYEKNSRYILVKCTENGNFVSLDNATMQCNIKMLTPDNRAIYNSCTIQDDGTVLVALTESMVYAAGDAVAELNIVDRNDTTLLATMSFHVIIKPSAYTDDAIIASNEFGALTEAITETNHMISVIAELETRINEEQIEWEANETLRQTNEEARTVAENDRAAAENARITNEDSRLSNENARTTGELLREQNEAKRQANESLREQNETARAEAEAQRETNTAAAIENANTAADNANTAADNANAAAERAGEITAVETMTSETLGIGKPDNDTITVSDGVFKAEIDKQLLDKLGESEEGTLTFNGQEIRTSTDYTADTKAEAQAAIDAGLVEDNATIYVREDDGDEATATAADVMTGATETSDGKSGLVPSPLSGQENYVLKGDGTWQPEVSIDVDDAISATSENPVQNKAVANELLKKADGIFYDEENSELQLKCGETVLAATTIENYNTTESASSIIISSTEPTDQNVGDLWFESESVSWTNTENGTYSFVQNGSTWTSNNNGVNSSTATSTWTINVTSDIEYTLKYKVSSETNYDKFTLQLDDAIIANAISGAGNEETYTVTLTSGTHTLVATYTKDSSVNSNDDLAYVILNEQKKIKQIKLLTDTGYVSMPIGCDAVNITAENIGALKVSDYIVDTELSTTSTNPVQNKIITAELDTVKKSVSDGKTAVANAITAKGVTTATDATFSTMAENIAAIETGSDMSLNVFTQETEPETKNGVWIQSANQYENIVVGAETYSNPAVGNWAQSTSLPYKFVEGSAVVYDNKIHILGSDSITSYRIKHYAFDGTSWTEVSTLPYNFYEGSAVVYDNKIHILGGGDSSITFTKHYAFDGTSWTKVSTLPYNFYYGSAVVYDNKIHILGGNYGTAAYTYHYAFDGTSWTEVSTLPYNLYEGSAVVYDNKIHILGGGSGGFAYTYHYAFDGTSWTEVSTLPYGFYEGSAVVYDNKIHILGSNTINNYCFSFDSEQYTEQYTGTTIIIYQNPSNTTGTYATDFLTSAPISGTNNKFPSGFDDVFYIDSSSNVEEAPTYYGDGTQWIKFKN